MYQQGLPGCGEGFDSLLIPGQFPGANISWGQQIVKWLQDDGGIGNEAMVEIDQTQEFAKVVLCWRMREVSDELHSLFCGSYYMCLAAHMVLSKFQFWYSKNTFVEVDNDSIIGIERPTTDDVCVLLGCCL